MTPGSTVQANITAAQACLNGSPATAAEWNTIARQLRRAADAARSVARIAFDVPEGAEAGWPIDATAPAPLSPDGRYLGL